MVMYVDEESGVVFHFNPDLSGGVEIVVPPDADGEGTSVIIPGAAVARFFQETFDRFWKRGDHASST